MSTVMGTMRKMEDSPMDEKTQTVAVRTGKNLPEVRGGCCNTARRRTLLKRRKRQDRINNGRRRIRYAEEGDRRRDARPERKAEEAGRDDGSGGDIPMDLSKRSVDEKILRHRCAESDRQQTEESEEEEQPLNLSRNPRTSTTQASDVAPSRCNSCPKVSSQPTQKCVTSSSPELLQKRVRLEEMVSYIRRYSVVDGGRNKAGGSSECHYGEMDEDSKDEDDEPNPFEAMPQAVKRSVSCSNLEPASVGRRRKSSAPYHGSVPPRKRLREEDAPEDLSGVDLVNGGAGFLSYPVLRQQLLGVDCRRLGLLQSVSSRNYTKDDCEYDEADDNDEEAEEAGGGEGSERENDEDGGALLHHQMRLLSTAASDPSQRFPWTAYAYYANLCQELQGTLASGAVPIPLSLALPLSIPTTESRGESPLSNEGGQASILMTTTPNSGGGNSSPTNTNAMFRKRAPRALTGKHVKHGTGASPATLLTLRQKIEQKRKQQQSATTALTRMDRKSTEANGIHKTMKSAAALLKKKKVTT